MNGEGRHTPDRINGACVVVTGAAGQLGGYLRRALTARGANVVGLGRRTSPGVDIVADLADRAALRSALAAIRPVLVFHAAAYTDVDGCERNPALADEINVQGSAQIARATREVGAHLVAISTDYVFGGGQGAPYAESAEPAPLSVYGHSKLGGETAVFAVNPNFAVVRTAWLFGGTGKHFPRTVLTTLRDRGAMDVVTDEWGSPTYAHDLAEALVALGGSGERGVFHLVNEGAASRFTFAQEVARAGGFDPERVSATTTAAFLARYPMPAPRPANSVLVNQRAAALGIVLRPWQEAISAYVGGLASELGLTRMNV